MKKILYIFIILLTTASCEEVIDLDLPFNDQRLVVDGLITSQQKQYTIKLALTEKYDFKYHINNSNKVSGAIVIVKDDVGNIDTLSETSAGEYKTNSNIIIGTIGRTYTLEIHTPDGAIWLSKPETMEPVPPIDSIYFERDKNDVSEDNPEYYKFTVYTDWHDPIDIDNYYLRNIEYNWGDTWHENITWNWVFNDKYINGKQIKKSILAQDYGGYPFYIRLNQFSLTKSAYTFWNLVHEQTAISGNDMVNASVPLFGNVYNKKNPNQYTLGYFQVSAHTSKTVFIDR